MASLKALNHWMLQDDRLAREFDGTLKLSPYYDAVRLAGIRSKISFFAPLTGDVNSPINQISGEFSRNSQGTYRAPLGTFLMSAADDESRHEYSPNGQALGLLMEPASTNKCENYNANPDQALTGMTDTLGGTLSRSLQIDLLADSGLSKLCRSGYVYRVITEESATDIVVDGDVGNLNDHQVSCFVNNVAGVVQLLLQGDTANALTIAPNTKLERFATLGVPNQTSYKLIVRVQPHTECFFILNQLEESEVISSVIVTNGAATSRAVDQLSWPLTPIFNQAEGMAAMSWIPHFGDEKIGLSTQTILLNTTTTGTLFLYFRKLSGAGVNRFQSFDGATTAFVDISPELVANQLYLIVMRWTATAFQIGYKLNGTWAWGPEAAHQAWDEEDNLFLLPLASSNAPLNSNSKNVYLWLEDKGQAWLEDFFSGEAN